MSRKKVGLFAAGVVFLFAACSGASATPVDVASANPTASPTTTTISVPATPTPLAATPTPAPATPAPTVAPTPAALTGTVVDVVDGDTIKVELSTGIEKVRIIGIDTPETVDPSRPQACYGPEASAFAHKTLDGKTVTLEMDSTQDQRDRYDRLLAHVHVGGKVYAAEAIAGGFGIHYIYGGVPSIHADELAAAQQSARDANLGIWAACDGRVDLPATPTDPPAAVDTPEPQEPAGDGCHPSYDPCVPDVGYDLDCKDIGFRVNIIGPDEYRLDGSDHDHKGCESYPPK
jgi:micrococcal nuclease